MPWEFVGGELIGVVEIARLVDVLNVLASTMGSEALKSSDCIESIRTQCRLIGVVALLAMIVSGTPLSAADAATSVDKMTPMFNGTDLAGWVRVNTDESTWTVTDDMLICSGKPIGELRTERMYQNFIMELEWRHMIPKGNAGVFVWADDITARGVPFHRGIEVQVLENDYGNTKSHTTHGDIFPIHGATMTPVNGRGGSRAFPTEERSKPSPEWNHYRITCLDGSISLAVNGKQVTQGHGCNPRKGYICLESEGGVVHYRNVRIRELLATPIPDEEVAIFDRGYHTLYNGLDLKHWNVTASAAEHWQPRDWVLHWDGNVNDDSGRLATVDQFTDFGFVVDVKLGEQSRSLKLELRGSPQAAVEISRDNPVVADQLAKPGQWNRIEGSLQGDRLSLRINGAAVRTDHVITDVPAEGPFAIIPSGPVDLANLYASRVLENVAPQTEPIPNADAGAESPDQMQAYQEKIEHTELSIDMVPIRGGSFVMGSPNNEPDRRTDEGPQHSVTVDPFWMGKFEITWDQYDVWGEEIDRRLREAFATDATVRDAVSDAVTRPTEPYTDMSFGMGKGSHPAICMTQHAARMYCKWLTTKTGRYYRLPTEAEWEYACRAGTTTVYSFGHDASKVDDYAWFSDNSDDAYHPVGGKQPNPWGLYDMHGNVAEWVLDQYFPDTYARRSRDTVLNPLAIPLRLYPRVVRGGGWDDNVDMLRSAVRDPSSEDWKQQDPQIPVSIWYHTDALGVGFRVVRPLTEPTLMDKALIWERHEPDQKDPDNE